MDLATSAQLSLAAGGRAFSADDAAELIGQASAQVRSYCLWHIAPQIPLELTLDSRGGRVLLLPTLRVVAVSSVAERGVPLVEDVDFEWSESGVLRRLRGCWPAKFRAVQVSCVAGYVDVPKDIAAVCAGGAGRLVGPWSQMRLGQLQVGRAAGEPTIGWSAEESAILDRYRRTAG